MTSRGVHRGMVYIDGNYYYKEFQSKITELKERLDFEQVIESLKKNDLDIRRIYHYMCLPYKNRPTSRAGIKFYKGARSFVNYINNIPRCHVRLVRPLTKCEVDERIFSLPWIKKDARNEMDYMNASINYASIAARMSIDLIELITKNNIDKVIVFSDGSSEIDEALTRIESKGTIELMICIRNDTKVRHDFREIFDDEQRYSIEDLMGCTVSKG